MIYASYPIDVVVGSFDYSNIDITDIPSYIKYSSSGINPTFYSNDIHSYYGDIDYTNDIISLNTNLLVFSDYGGKRYLNPASSFLFEDSDVDSRIAVLQCNYSNYGYLLHPIVMYLDAYGNEAINGWDGTAIEVNEDGGYILAP
jgi:hypothetical protein